MGQALIERVGDRSESFVIAAQWDRTSTDEAIAQESKGCDVVVDFSSPEALHRFLRISHPVSLVTGTTGLHPKTVAALKKWGTKKPTLSSPNFSLGVHLVSLMLESVSQRWAPLGFSASLVETHHTQKKDSPSGTALRLAQDMRLDRSRIASHRVGNVLGVHEIFFESQLEQIRVRHEARDRKVFAEGALHVAAWLFKSRKKRKPGKLFTFDDFFMSLKMEKQS